MKKQIRLVVAGCVIFLLGMLVNQRLSAEGQGETILECFEESARRIAFEKIREKVKAYRRMQDKIREEKELRDALHDDLLGRYMIEADKAGSRRSFEIYIRPNITEFQQAIQWSQDVEEIERIKKKLLERVKKIVCSGTGLNRQGKGSGYTPLHSAVSINDLEMVNLLLNNGADPNIQGKEGNTPLHLAITFKASDAVISALRRRGANVNAQNKIGLTPLHYACNLGTCNYTASPLRLFNGINPEIMDRDGCYPLTMSVIYGNTKRLENFVNYFETDLDVKDPNKNTFLHNAVFAGSVEMVAKLLSYGVKLNERNIVGNTPLGCVSELLLRRSRVKDFLLTRERKNYEFIKKLLLKFGAKK